jgi:sugar/nucleoside kinase (ribokinase family)
VPYDRLTRELPESDPSTVTTLPDGSIDHYCTLSGSGTVSLETRESFARELGSDRSSFQFHVDTVEPGGQAVNAARQLDALGDSVTCYGHLDAPVFDPLPFETVSMGDPSTVYVFTFDDRDVMFVRDSAVMEWTLADLRRVADLPAVFGGDAVCCSNWDSVPGLERAFYRLGDEDLPRVPFVFDPGDIVDRDSEGIGALHDAIAALQNTFDVVYNVNRGEVRATAEPLSGSVADDVDRLAAIREATGITAAVMHARDEAAVATGEGTRRVENYRIERPERHTGGGDRFTGGLAHALACGWDWETALACGNVCAAHYVETSETGTVEDLVGFIEDRPAPEA